MRASVGAFGSSQFATPRRSLSRAVVEERRDAPALRILPGGQRAARGRADGRVHIELREANALGGEPIDVRRLRILVAEAGEVAPAHVVDEDHDEVRLPGGLGRAPERNEQRREDEETEDAFHFEAFLAGLSISVTGSPWRSGLPRTGWVSPCCFIQASRSAAHGGDALSVLWIGGEVVEFVGVAGEVVEFFGWACGETLHGGCGCGILFRSGEPGFPIHESAGAGGA